MRDTRTPQRAAAAGQGQLLAVHPLLRPTFIFVGRKRGTSTSRLKRAGEGPTGGGALRDSTNLVVLGGELSYSPILLRAAATPAHFIKQQFKHDAKQKQIHEKLCG